MKQQTFEKLYRQGWDELEQMLLDSEHSVMAFWQNKTKDGRLPHLYRRVCHHLSLAQERRYSSHLVARLNDLVLRSHQQLYRRQTRFFYHFLRFVVVIFPARVRQNLGYFWLANGIFYGPALLLFVLVQLQPELIFNMLSHASVGEFESMYDPAAERIGLDREAQSDLQMFGHYIQNNISIGFQTFATGLFLGLGSIFYMAYNGLLFGAMSSHVVNIGYQDTFFSFVIAHGSVELTAIVIAGMGGLMLGHSLIAPGQQTRLDALKSMGLKTLDLLYGVILLLVLAAFIEAFWSSNTALPLWLKYSVGTFLWLLVFAYLAFCGRGKTLPKDSAKGQ